VKFEINLLVNWFLKVLNFWYKTCFDLLNK
jgi:hypothetical protein